MITLYQFIAMDEMEQADAIWGGTLLGERSEQGYQVLLYAVGDFYVEVFYHRKLNVTHRFRPFKQTALLDPYLEQIDVEKLL